MLGSQRVVRFDSPHLDIIVQCFRCSTSEAEQIGARATSQTYARNEILSRAGDKIVDTILVVAGLLGERVIELGGRPLQIREYSVGDLFGAGFTGDGTAPFSEICAIRDSQVMSFNVGALLDLAHRYSCVWQRIAVALLEDLNARNEFIASQFGFNATARVCNFLADMAQKSENGAIRPRPNFTDVALQTNTARETVSRTYSSLKREVIVADI